MELTLTLDGRDYAVDWRGALDISAPVLAPDGTALAAVTCPYIERIDGAAAPNAEAVAGLLVAAGAGAFVVLGGGTGRVRGGGRFCPRVERRWAKSG